MKIKELMSVEGRLRLAEKYYYKQAEKISQPLKINDGLYNEKLERKRQLMDKYGKLPLKPGFNKKHRNFNVDATIA